MPKRLWISLLSVWPGLPQIWSGQEVLGLILAGLFGAMLNLAIVTRFVWTELVAPGVPGFLAAGAFPVEAERQPVEQGGAAGIGLREHAERRDLRELQDLRHGIERPVRHAGGIELRRPVRPGLLAHDPGDHAEQQLAALEALDVEIGRAHV